MGIKYFHFVNPQFLSLGSIYIFGPDNALPSEAVSCRMFSSIPGIFPLDASSRPRDSQNYFRTWQNVTQGEKSPLLENYCVYLFRFIFKLVNFSVLKILIGNDGLKINA